MYVDCSCSVYRIFLLFIFPLTAVHSEGPVRNISASINKPMIAAIPPRSIRKAKIIETVIAIMTVRNQPSMTVNICNTVYGALASPDAARRGMSPSKP